MQALEELEVIAPPKVIPFECEINPPDLWGAFSYQIEGLVNVRELNIVKFYQLGKELKSILKLKTGATMFDVEGGWFTLVGIKPWLHTFWEETKDLSIPKTRKAIGRLDRVVRKAGDRLMIDFQAKKDPTLTLEENTAVREALETFEKEFEHESRQLAVFGVTPKGDRDVRILIDDASKKFPQDYLAVMPQHVIDDLQEAGKCLAFERATACAFHICRATEALMIAYYEKLTGQPWPPPPMRKVWGVIVDQLAVKGAPREITNRLKELREDRNSFAHPDVTVSKEEAPIVYEICTGSMFYMAKEMLKP